MIPYKPISKRLTDDGYDGLSDSEKMIITEQMRYMSDMEKLFRKDGSALGRDDGENVVGDGSKREDNEKRRWSVWRRLKEKIIKLFR